MIATTQYIHLQENLDIALVMRADQWHKAKINFQALKLPGFSSVVGTQ